MLFKSTVPRKVQRTAVYLLLIPLPNFACVCASVVCDRVWRCEHVPRLWLNKKKINRTKFNTYTDIFGNQQKTNKKITNIMRHSVWLNHIHEIYEIEVVNEKLYRGEETHQRRHANRFGL